VAAAKFLDAPPEVAYFMVELPINLLVSRLREGRCVPFLGAGANVKDSKRKYGGLPLGGEVASRLASDLHGIRDPRNLARVSLQHERTNDRDFLLSRLKEIIPDAACKPSPLLNVIAGLPFKLIVTTNYDRLLEAALDASGRPFRLIVQTTNGAQNAPAVAEWAAVPAEERPLLVYKIHGTFLEKQSHPGVPVAVETSPVVVTEDDYIDFISVLSNDGLGVPQIIRQEMSYSTLLFLGYSLEDWDFRALYKSLVMSQLTPNGTRKSIAIQKGASEAWRKFWMAQQVDIYDVHIYDFAQRLLKAANGAGK
jgi:SIR2-like protein